MFVLASQTGTSNPAKDIKYVSIIVHQTLPPSPPPLSTIISSPLHYPPKCALPPRGAETTDGLKEDKETKPTSSPTPDPSPLVSMPRPPLPRSETGDLQLAMKLQKEEEQARRLQLEADEQLAEQLQNKENTFAVPAGDIPSVQRPPSALLQNIKAGALQGLKSTSSPKLLSPSSNQAVATPTHPLPPPPPPLPNNYSSPTPSTKQKVLAGMRSAVTQLGKHLRPVTTVEKRAFRVGECVCTGCMCTQSRYMCIHTTTHTYTHNHTYIHTHILYMHTHTHNTHKHIHNTHSCTHIHTHTNTYTTHTHTHTHTHTPSISGHLCHAHTGKVVEEDEPQSVVTFQYEITNFNKNWLNQVEIKEPISPFPLGSKCLIRSTCIIKIHKCRGGGRGCLTGYGSMIELEWRACFNGEGVSTSLPLTPQRFTTRGASL